MRLLWLVMLAGVPALGPPSVVPGVAEPVPVVVRLSGGAGPVVGPGDVVVTGVEVRSWAGEVLSGTRAATVRELPEAWRAALLGRARGSRVMLVGPPAEVFPGLSTGAPVVVVVFDVVGGYPPDARLGATHPPDAGTGRTRPSERLPHATRTLIDGSGPAVRPGATVVLRYTVTHDGAVLHAAGPEGFVVGRGAWTESLAGQHVGARLTIARGPLLYLVDIIDTI
ncbi:hypothetical protein OIE66_42255 [Nonomuraea sp. NBC_01738]|uniref:hypothetical protein n=1 Tax=Nonomuraea sp. NBC_01738 TaxID=2976003 RepID=UPI002E13FD0D|nr:hypothetical protein OIE66_42255 [Nonomuraea sp. NBC_01738]